MVILNKLSHPVRFFVLERCKVSQGGVPYQCFPNNSSCLGCYSGRGTFLPPEDSTIPFRPDFPTSGFEDPVPGSLKERFLGEQEGGELPPASEDLMDRGRES